MNELKNCWYVAALHDELEPKQLLPRTFLGEPVVLFRHETGTPQALQDRCPHRFAPLSMGTLCERGEKVRCGYHGLEFDGSGKCTSNPQGQIPKAAVVKSYPVREVAGLIWIWMGAPEQADESLIPDYSQVTSSSKDASFKGYLPTACDTMLLVDNILDLSHVDFLHPTTLGSGALSRTKAVVSEPDTRSVRITWLSQGDKAPHVFDMHLREQEKPTDQWTEVTWTAPSTMLLTAGATLQGEPRASGVGTLNLHLATPERPGSTHYWYWSSRDFAVSQEANARIQPIVEHVFKQEDKPMLEAQQRNLGGSEIFSLKPVLLPADAGAVRVRRKLQALKDAEAGSRSDAGSSDHEVTSHVVQVEKLTQRSA